MSGFRGLTWDHPRGCRALEAAAAKARAEGLDLVWERQPLEGFESAPIGDLAARYDLVVMDHPHVGAAVAAEAFRPLDAVFDAVMLAVLSRAAVGPAFGSYVYGGRSWALPLDAATQVCAYRADLLDSPPPSTWGEVEALAAQRPVGLCLAGPHAALSFLALAVALGEPPASRDPDVLVAAETGQAALAILRALYALRARAADGLNPIGVLEAMASGDGIALCPLVYGYVTYARAQGGRTRAVAFADAPSAAAGGRPGSVLGGTGIAVSARCTPSAGLVAHLEWLMTAEAQVGFIPAEAGQPALRGAWTDASVNRDWGGFYAGTLRTIEAAWVRPRHPGFVAFQTDASAVLRAGLEDVAPDAALLGRLQDLYAASRAHGGEI